MNADETTSSPDPASPDLLASLAGSGGVRKFRANVTVAAVRWTGSNHDDVAALAGDAWPGGVAPNPPADDLIVDTPHGEARCQVGDWIIRGVTGKFFTCKPDIFEATYEPAETASTEAEAALDAPPAPGTGTSDPGGEPCPHCAKERERSVPEPDGEPVIDMGYLVGQLMDAAERHHAGTSASCDALRKRFEAILDGSAVISRDDAREALNLITFHAPPPAFRSPRMLGLIDRLSAAAGTGE